MAQKVLFTASTYSHIARFHRPYLRAFRDMGWSADVACGGTPLPIPEAERVIHLPLEKSMTSPSNLRAASLLRQELIIENYDLISAHTSLASFFTRLAARGLEVPVVSTCHGYLFDSSSPALRRTALLWAEKLTAGRTDLLLTMNRQDRAIADRHRLGRHIASIPGMGVDFSRFDAVPPQAGPALRAKLGLPDGAFALIYPAEFSPRKSQETLLRSLPLLPQRVCLLLPGDGALLDSCRALADSLGVAGRVVFPGNVDDMAPWYAAADAAVSSSRIEGLPFNVMEAMYHALPAVVTAVKGHEDLIRDGETGLLFPYGDSAACAGQIARLLDEPGLAPRLGSAARQAVLPYGLDTVLPQVLEAYRAVLPSLPVPQPV